MNTFQKASTEALRCLQCFDAPCIGACPTHINIPRFVAQIASGNLMGAAAIVKSANALANICGTVCPEEVFCQSVCNRAKIDMPIQIRELHGYATRSEAERGYVSTKPFPSGGRRVAVVGSGPAGLGCAFELVKYGHDVTVFECHNLGGVPSTTIPSFRLPPETIESDLTFLNRFFVMRRRRIGTEDLADLNREFSAVFLSVGLGEDRTAGIQGEHLRGVYPVLPYLEVARREPEKAPRGKRVIVIGGGNVSLDAAATAKKLGAGEVTLLYRRSEKELRVWTGELDQARRAGVQLRCLTLPVEIRGEIEVQSVVCWRTELSEQIDSTGRPVPVEVAGSEHTLTADMVIVAIGQVLGQNLFPQIRRTAKGYLTVDDRLMTSVPGVFAGGDAIAGEGTVVQSVAHGKRAGRSIHEYVSTLS